ncbi:MAG: hypothetical protein RBG1_1C00001G0109 [candidate division Zixibacteria bacterium RBG-1]|nr:MAG: hypothetical protein RBG1_1C00001G0109 [candidate division Zixibacteria bacterium RBG-1]
MEVLKFLFVPFVASLVITGIHVYLGVHVVERGVIFVDLALAQMAALGVTIGFLLGYGLHTPASFWWSLGFTLMGALIFTLTRRTKTKIPQEAFIGIAYVISAAAAILAMSQAPEGTEHLKDMLVGNILTVSWSEIIKIFIIYSLIGVFHWVFRRNFITISTNPQKALEKGISIPLWDFLFYLSFGLVVTYSVSIAGVLLVFSFLIVPSVCAMLFADKIGYRLIIGWGLSTLVSILGIALSYLIDLPTGATIVCTFGLALIMCVLVKFFYRSVQELNKNKV